MPPFKPDCTPSFKQRSAGAVKFVGGGTSVAQIVSGTSSPVTQLPTGPVLLTNVKQPSALRLVITVPAKLVLEPL